MTPEQISSFLKAPANERDESLAKKRLFDINQKGIGMKKQKKETKNESTNR